MKTNADVIRSMTDEQLCEFLQAVEIGDIDTAITFCDMCKEGGNELGYDCDTCFRSWVIGSAYAYNGLLTPGINSGYFQISKEGE